MRNNPNQNSINIKYILVTLFAVVSTWILHEFAHWATGELLGNKMIMTLNASYPVSGSYIKLWHEPLISIAGPVITILQAIIIYVLIKNNSNRFLFPFLLTCLYMRMVAGVLNIINLNDEGRVSTYLGLGTYTIPLIVSSLLFALTYNTTRREKYSTKFIAISILLIMVFSSILILGDQVWKVKILAR